MKSLPVVFAWRAVNIVDDDGQIIRRFVMDPLPRYGNLARRQYRENEEHPMAIVEARNRKFHNYFFAAVHEGWLNLPEEISARFDDENHLRKFLLVKTGFHEEKEFDFGGPGAADDAARLGAFIRTGSEYAFIQTVRLAKDHVRVIVRRAKSQAENAMGAEFDESAKAVLDALEAMIGLPSGTLKKAAGNHA